ncbi:Asp-tRNA(Asn)/Glu-tRNA(Gln) amidotransferase subunit GatB [Candidatus Magnetaquicoccus inordinatus]|uniref:Asp-tRNA(Asn)/Glu-tRNA(Gln) amidotransferase subunit GatB n=1 Tax=Candidatus Magnetaquicoccus inordinatus TaxID=2496818 RepID=UPI00102C58D7|nr:Asp-tRNA(Asn)/Glu-tRNA(Gln) amidotransferase subunit GatB [Candidatus Magnetaquicoccus inordinatus]
MNHKKIALRSGTEQALATGYETVIGLEVHAQMLTQSKIFCGCPTRFGADANTQICPVCAAFPGVLPVLNREAVQMAIKTGLAIHGQIRLLSEFSRKNYFYPDLPAGYQISQYELPIVEQGHLMIDSPERGEGIRIGITRIHMEVDAGKSLHEGIVGGSWVDLNRTGTPLMEIVSEPDLRSSAEAGEYLKKLRAIVRYLGVCDGNMEEGSFRCDANVSVRLRGASAFGTRCELKNLNSIRNVMRAIDYEVERQIELLEEGGKVIQETRLWNADLNSSRPMRGKEDAHDYRYFPEPDLPPLRLTAERVAAISAVLPELPDAKALRFQEQYQLSHYDAGVLTSSRELADFFEAVAAEAAALGQANAKMAANWVTGELAARLNRDGVEIQHSPVTPGQLGKLVAMIQQGTLSGKLAKEVFEILCNEGGDPQQIAEQRGMRQVSDEGAIDAAIEQVLANNPEDVAQYRAGKSKILGFLVGQVMKATQGKANPGLVNQRLLAKLAE